MKKPRLQTCPACRKRQLRYIPRTKFFPRSIGLIAVRHWMCAACEARYESREFITGPLRERIKPTSRWGLPKPEEATT